VVKGLQVQSYLLLLLLQIITTTTTIIKIHGNNMRKTIDSAQNICTRDAAPHCSGFKFHIVALLYYVQHP
jgi:hypothetical protein